MASSALSFQGILSFIGDTIRSVGMSLFGADLFGDIIQYVYSFLFGSGTLAMVSASLGGVIALMERFGLKEKIENFEKSGNDKKDMGRVFRMLADAVEKNGDDEEESAKTQRRH